MELFHNYPLFAALTAIIFAQVVKIPISLIVTREFKPDLAFSTGGMPSSHSAAVAALTTGVGIVEGVSSTMFAISCVFSVIIMFDATGVRRQAGEQAIVLNQLIKDFQLFIDGAKDWTNKKQFEKRQELKELLGHQPIEVFFGGLTGVAIAFILNALLN
ncbi:MAG: divergent PAP2 family protein [Bacillota bacterium]|uniref:Divergent PAP2 family protein n=1 Tax=Virgibacillus salarius TaxID=447199 RepID=A0A941DS76_9BACI|nr:MULTISPECIES: divergent PAP2 family protein [Bacillaceae]NAZ07264.1 divergent PAP2 family protein [Agaribacter marinus]MBR7794542.1 divergent PAP2 family protein [Virgibacillus salarius]MCC2249469.1 divergent PAP2 family protein [Virgibacillus sp. AGTR]MDY7043333.1 divergent PAP2 family protein [Virgibacillus sp. M23]QRZ17836.1 divergent PAP2 family protein [Virgibacillus sp. AGTR]